MRGGRSTRSSRSRPVNAWLEPGDDPDSDEGAAERLERVDVLEAEAGADRERAHGDEPEEQPRRGRAEPLDGAVPEHEAEGGGAEARVGERGELVAVRGGEEAGRAVDDQPGGEADRGGREAG